MRKWIIAIVGVLCFAVGFFGTFFIKMNTPIDNKTEYNDYSVIEDTSENLEVNNPYSVEMKKEETHEGMRWALSKKAGYKEGNTPSEWIEYSYDEVGNITTIELVDKDGERSITDQYIYDNQGRLIEGFGYTYSYDSNGNIVKKGDTEYEYDSNNRLISQRRKDGLIIDYKYDLSGNKIEKYYHSQRSNGERNDSMMQWEYDADGHIVKCTHNYIDSGLIHTQRFQYDKEGRLIKITSEYNDEAMTDEQSVSTYEYSNGHLVKSSEEWGNKYTNWTEYEYDLNGHIKKANAYEHDEMIGWAEYDCDMYGNVVKIVAHSAHEQEEDKSEIEEYEYVLIPASNKNEKIIDYEQIWRVFNERNITNITYLTGIRDY